MTTSALKPDFVFMYSNRKMSNTVTGMTTFSRSRTRIMFSYWPLQVSE